MNTDVIKYAVLLYPTANAEDSAALASEIRGAIGEVMFYPVQIAVARGFCALAVNYVLGNRACFLAAFIILVTSVVVPLLNDMLLLIPWSIVFVIQGRYLNAVLLLVLYSAATNVAENQIFSLDEGRKPFLGTLLTLSIWLGATVYGLVGLVWGPLLLSVLLAVSNEIAGKKDLSTDSWYLANFGKKEDDADVNGGATPTKAPTPM